ncbi:hypothetical protein BH10ACI3_BH10ACI3_23110 [soil metagenome]
MKKQIENTTENNTQTASDPPAVAGGSGVQIENVTAQTLTPKGVTLNETLNELQKENEQLKATIRLDAAHRQITGELAKGGARSPELLFDAVKGDLQFAANGSVANAAALVERLKSGFPEQFGGGSMAGSVDGGAGGTPTPQLSRDALAKMKPAEIAALDWAEVKRVLSAS